MGMCLVEKYNIATHGAKSIELNKKHVKLNFFEKVYKPPKAIPRKRIIINDFVILNIFNKHLFINSIDTIKNIAIEHMNNILRHTKEMDEVYMDNICSVPIRLHILNEQRVSEVRLNIFHNNNDKVIAELKIEFHLINK